MKKIFFLLLILHSTCSIHYSSAKSHNWMWAKVMGGTGGYIGNCLTLDASNHVYVTGSFGSTVGFGSTTLTSAGDFDIFIAKLDAMTIITGTNDVAKVSDGVLVLPNPAEKELRIQNTELRIESVEIFDVLGEKVFREQLSTGIYPLTIEVSQLSSGIYFFESELAERIHN